MNNQPESERAIPLDLRASLQDREHLAQKFQHFQNAFHEEGLLDERLLELCRTRIDALHSMPATTTLDEETQALVTQGQFSSFTQIEQQALSIAEQMAIDAHGVTDQQVTALVAELGEAAAVSLITAASMHDATVRMQLVMNDLGTSNKASR